MCRKFPFTISQTLSILIVIGIFGLGASVSHSILSKPPKPKEPPHWVVCYVPMTDEERDRVKERCNDYSNKNRGCPAHPPLYYESCCIPTAWEIDSDGNKTGRWKPVQNVLESDKDKIVAPNLVKE